MTPAKANVRKATGFLIQAQSMTFLNYKHIRLHTKKNNENGAKKSHGNVGPINDADFLRFEQNCNHDEYYFD